MNRSIQSLTQAAAVLGMIDQSDEYSLEAAVFLEELHSLKVSDSILSKVYLQAINRLQLADPQLTHASKRDIYSPTYPFYPGQANYPAEVSAFNPLQNAKSSLQKLRLHALTLITEMIFLHGRGKEMDTLLTAFETLNKRHSLTPAGTPEQFVSLGGMRNIFPQYGGSHMLPGAFPGIQNRQPNENDNDD